MLVTKCDLCKREIEDREEVVTAGVGWDRHSVCTRCGRPSVAFLKKSKLLPKGAKGLAADLLQPAKMAGQSRFNRNKEPQLMRSFCLHPFE